MIGLSILDWTPTSEYREEEAEEECKHEFTTTRLLQHVYLYWFETLLSEIWHIESDHVF